MNDAYRIVKGSIQPGSYSCFPNIWCFVDDTHLPNSASSSKVEGTGVNAGTDVYSLTPSIHKP